MGFIKIEQRRKRREGEKESFLEIVSHLVLLHTILLCRVETVLHAAARSSQLAANNCGGLASNHVQVQTRRCDSRLRSISRVAQPQPIKGVDASSSLRLCVLLLPWLRPEGDQVKSRTRFDCRPAVFSFCLMINWNYTLKRLGSQFYPATTRYLACETSHEAANS